MSPKKITKPLDVYVRVSRVGGRDGDSYITEDVQEERCRALAQARGLSVGRVFLDRDQSGGKMERPEFDVALGRIRAGESGGIIVARLDRFARTLVGGLQTLEMIQEAGGVVLTAEGDFDTSTNTGELVLNMMLSLAQFELRRIKESWDVARARAVERGIHVSVAPAGYRKRADGTLEPSEHAPAITKAFEMRAAGASQSEIARHLLRAEVPTAGQRSSRMISGSWSIRAVQLLLRNRAYLGEARSGAYVKEGAHEPLVSRGLFKAVQDMRGTAKAASKNGGDGPLLGGGMLRCASCGCRMGMDSTKARGKTYWFYRCKSNPGCPAKVSISATKIEPYLEGIVRLFLARGQYEPELPADELGALRVELEDARAYLAELDEAVRAGQRIAPSTLSAATATVEAAQEALDAAEAAQEVPLQFATSAEAWDSLPVPERRRILKALLGTVVVRRGKGLSVADRIERPDAPEDWAAPEPDDEMAARVAERFASLYREHGQRPSSPPRAGGRRASGSARLMRG